MAMTTDLSFQEIGIHTYTCVGNELNDDKNTIPNQSLIHLKFRMTHTDIEIISGQLVSISDITVGFFHTNFDTNQI